MAKIIRVILIDPFDQTVTEHEIKDTLQAYYKLIGCDMIEGVSPNTLTRGNSLYCDEEALLKDEQPSFYMEGWGYIMGRAIVVRHDAEGETVSTTQTVKEIRDLVIFE